MKKPCLLHTVIAVRENDQISKNRRWKRKDGIALLLFKKLFALPFALWHEAIFNRACSPFRAELPPKQRHIRLDAWQYGWLLVLCAFYLASIYIAQHAIPVQWIILLFLILSMARLYEGCTIAALLHCNDRYRTQSKARAILGVLMLYSTTIVAFAIWYVYLTTLYGPGFGEGFTDDWTTPIYFSAVTITTLGYGEFVPKGSVERLAVSFELAVGIFLFTVILARAFAGETSMRVNSKA